MSTKKPIYKKWWFWVVVVFVIIGALGGKKEQASPTAQPAAAQPQPESSSQQVPTSPAVETKPVALFNIKDIANKSEQEVAKVLGNPIKKEDGKFRYAGTDKYLPAPTLFYKEGTVEIKFVEGKVARVTVTPKIEFKYPDNLKQAFEIVGLKVDTLQQTDQNAAFENVNGIYQGQAFNDNGKVGYLYFIVDKKYQ